ncbi:MAG: hypothetical protein ABSG68_24840 [Thermoguttaceae bacterium]|jgi:hypothetical protein
MKWEYFSLGNNNAKAKKHVLDNLSMGACSHTLSRKLLSRFSEADGSMLLIAFESLDLGADCLYEYATYGGGKRLKDLPGFAAVTWMDSPRWGLVPFVDKHLLKSREAVVLCENWAATREAVAHSPRESTVLLYGDEVYHVLTGEDAASPDAIECALRESEHHWATGLCSFCRGVPPGEIASEAFFDVVVANAAHIFTPALDGGGYLIWSPEQKRDE